LTTGFDDIVFAISFSPDGHTLAIARGASEPTQRFGRIELWDTESGTLRHVIKGFDGPVTSVSFSPDGETLVSGSTEYRSSKIKEKALSRYGDVLGELKWWDAKTGDLKHKLTLPGEGNSSISATYSPDGKQLAIVETFVQYSLVSNPGFGLGVARPNANEFDFRPSVYHFADVKVLDAQTGEQQLKLDAGWPKRAIFSPDGKFLALENGNEIKVWDTQTGKKEQKLKGLKGRLSSIAFSPDSQSLAVAVTQYHDEPAGSMVKVMADSEVRLFDVNTWKVTRQLSKLGAVNSLVFGPSGNVLLIGGLISIKDGAIPGVKLWDLSNGNSANLPTGGEDFSEAVGSLVLTHSGTLLALLTGTATVKILDTRAWQVKQTFDEKSSGDESARPTSRFVLSVKRVVAVAFSPDGNTLSGELEQGEIKLWDHRTGEVKKQLAADTDAPSLVAIAAEGKTLAEVSNGSLRVWSANSDAKRDLPLTGSESISAIALSTDGQTLAVAGGKQIRLLNVVSGQVLQTLARGQSAVDRIAFSEDGGLVAVADEGGSIEIWNAATAQIEKTMNLTGKVTALRFAPDGHTLATATEDHSISLWNVSSGLQQQRLQKQSATINALAFSADGQFLASGSDDCTVVIWDLVAGKSKRTLKGQDQTVTALAFSPDGTLLASAGGDASVVVWEVRKGNVNRVLR
jgi:WD40 repeat protein